MPRAFRMTILVLCVLALIPFALIARSREQTAPRTRIAVIQDMAKQPKYGPQTANPLFADGRAMRLPVAGAVARGELADNDALYRGLAGNAWVKTVPLPVTPELLRRGQERFNIYCAVCHGLSGYGNGTVAVRAIELADQGQAKWVPPTSYHSDELRGREAGSLFNTITNGVRNMPPYGSQIEVKDRWAIVSYIRALQRSQYTKVEDVPEDKREDLR